jgi:hypothetical protein
VTGLWHTGFQVGLERRTILFPIPLMCQENQRRLKAECGGGGLVLSGYRCACVNLDAILMPDGVSRRIVTGALVYGR